MPIDRCVISGLLYGQLIQNRIYVGTETFQEVNEVAAHIWNSWVNTIKVFQHQSLVYNSVEVRRVQGGNNEQFTELRNVPAGQLPEEANFSFVSGVLQFQTGMAGRPFRGRYYCAAIRLGDTRLGQFNAQGFGLWQGQIDILKNAYVGPNGGSTGLQLLIRGEKVVHNTPVTDIALRPTLGVQRRRNIGVGA